MLKELGEDFDLPVPVAGDPNLSQPRVEGLVDLALDVGFVRGVAGSDSDASGGYVGYGWRADVTGCGGGPAEVLRLKTEDKKENGESEKEREKHVFESEKFWLSAGFHVVSA